MGFRRGGGGRRKLAGCLPGPSAPRESVRGEKEKERKKERQKERRRMRRRRRTEREKRRKCKEKEEKEEAVSLRLSNRRDTNPLRRSFSSFSARIVSKMVGYSSVE
ncbi:hypothetical protein ANTQUA_LOCUS10209 [Anthophora quadrimaculata]